MRRATIALLGCLGLSPEPGAAQSGGPFTLTWSTIDGGGSTFAEAGAFRLGGTTGQPDAAQLSAGNFTLSGGFWVGGLVGPVDAGPSPSNPTAFAARPAAPNPSSGATTLSFDLPMPRHVSLALYGTDGRLVRRLVDQDLGAGRHQAVWDGRDGKGRRVAAGVYFARIRAGEFEATRRVVRLD